jgi:hypothetical protein
LIDLLKLEYVMELKCVCGKIEGDENLMETVLNTHYDRSKEDRRMWSISNSFVA